MERRRDAANLYVLEAVLVALLLMGSAYAVTTLRRSALADTAPSDGLRQLGADALLVLDGLAGEDGTQLETAVLEALHCAHDATPSVHACHARRPANLTLRLGGYLPPGAGWSLQMSNGASQRVVYATGAPVGQASSSSVPFVPSWNTTFVLPELSCASSTSSVNVTMLPLRGARVSDLTALNLSYGGATQLVAERASGGWWNATVPASRPATATLVANASGRSATFNGSTTVGTCPLSGAEPVVVPALRQASIVASPAPVALGGSTTFTADLAPLAGLSGVTRGSSEVLVYEAISPRDAPDTWILAERLALPSGDAPSVTWTPPATSSYGAHVAVLRVNMTASGEAFVAQRATVVDVALPTGQVPLDAMYRLHLLTWMPDWP